VVSHQTETAQFLASLYAVSAVGILRESTSTYHRAQAGKFGTPVPPSLPTPQGRQHVVPNQTETAFSLYQCVLPPEALINTPP
jgi:hypothetical protein